MSMLRCYALMVVLAFSVGIARAEDSGAPGDSAAPSAGEPAQNAGPRSCRGEVEKFCKDVKPGGGRILKCLKSHHDELSEECKESFDEKMEKLKERREKRKERREKKNPNGGKFEEACGDDVQKYCSNIEEGHGSIIGCLRQHTDQLSPSCKALWKGRGPGRAKPAPAPVESNDGTKSDGSGNSNN